MEEDAVSAAAAAAMRNVLGRDDGREPVDDLVRLMLVEVALLNAGWAINSLPPADATRPVMVQAAKERAVLCVPVDVTRPSVVARVVDGRVETTLCRPSLPVARLVEIAESAAAGGSDVDI